MESLPSHCTGAPPVRPKRGGRLIAQPYPPTLDTTMHERSRSILVSVLIASILLALTGPTVLRPRASGKGFDGEWFACAGRQCGCRTAEMCRKQCCCTKTVPVIRPVQPPCCPAEDGESRGLSPNECHRALVAHSNLPVILSAHCSGREGLLILAATSWLVSAGEGDLPTIMVGEPVLCFASPLISAESGCMDPPPPRLTASTPRIV